MTEIPKHIRTGFYSDFKGFDTILISVDIHGLLEIEKAFLGLAQGITSFNFSKFKNIDPKYKVDIIAYANERNVGLKKINKGKFEWRLQKAKWSWFQEMATALYRLGTSGHQYLDTETGDIDLDSLQVILSFNEYPISFWKEHFNTCNS